MKRKIGNTEFNAESIDVRALRTEVKTIAGYPHIIKYYAIVQTGKIIISFLGYHEWIISEKEVRISKKEYLKFAKKFM